MITIVDYGVGNLFSLKSSLRMVGADAMITGDIRTIENADKIILPGVGAFEDAARKLRTSGLDEVICQKAKSGTYLMGICLGMQMLFDRSYEHGIHAGLGLIPGDVIDMRPKISENLKVPHIGWNALHFTKPKHALFQKINEGDFVYFVHSYYAAQCDHAVIATTEYSILLTAAVASDNILGCQFHPEKSGEIGLKILKTFCEL